MALKDLTGGKQVTLLQALGITSETANIPGLQTSLSRQVQAAQEAQSTGSGNPANIPLPKGTNPASIWKELINAGATAVQAAGIMGNWIHESSLNVESKAMDTNGKMVYGLASWNAGSYPTASSLVTGNPAADLQRQVRFLVQTGGLRAASGSTVQQTAGNYAANYERCQGCQSGGTQWAARIQSALSMMAEAVKGRW